MRFIYLDKAGNQVGPVDESVIIQEIRAGHLQADSAIRNAVLQDFYTVAEFPNFRAVLQQTPQTGSPSGGFAGLRFLAENNALKRDQTALGIAMCPGDASMFRRVCSMLTDMLVLLPLLLLIFLPPMGRMHIWGELDKEEIMLQLEFSKIFKKSGKQWSVWPLPSARPKAAVSADTENPGKSTIFGRALNGSREKIREIASRHNAAVQNEAEPIKPASVPVGAESGKTVQETAADSRNDSFRDELAAKFVSATAAGGDGGSAAQPQVSILKMPGGDVMGTMLPNKMLEWDAAAAGRAGSSGRARTKNHSTASPALSVSSSAAASRGGSRAQRSHRQGRSRFVTSQNSGGSAASAFDRARSGSMEKMTDSRIAISRHLEIASSEAFDDIHDTGSVTAGDIFPSADVVAVSAEQRSGRADSAGGSKRTAGSSPIAGSLAVSAEGSAGEIRWNDADAAADFSAVYAADKTVGGEPAGTAPSEQRLATMKKMQLPGAVSELLNSADVKQAVGGQSVAELLQKLPAAEKARSGAAAPAAQSMQCEAPFSLRDLLITGCAIQPDVLQLRLGSGIRKIPRAEFQRNYQKPLKWAVLAVVLYYTLCFSIFAQTFGMWFWGIFLTRSRVAEVLPLRALLYTVAMLLSGIFMIPCVLLTKRSLADWICRVRQIGVGSISKS